MFISRKTWTVLQVGRKFSCKPKMAKSKFEYVREFEAEEKCLPNCWIVVRIDGKKFSNFSDAHGFEKPNDLAALKLMNQAATSVMEEFNEIVISFGESDEYSFCFKKETVVYNRRGNEINLFLKIQTFVICCNPFYQLMVMLDTISMAVYKILSNVNSLFSSSYVFHWNKFFPNTKLLYPPTFDARIVLYPSDQNLRDYLSWRQADTHINNLYNTCFWNLVQKKNLTNAEAQDQLKGTTSADKNELLFQDFKTNYNNEPQIFRKGTILVRKYTTENDLSKVRPVPLHVDLIGDAFWNEHPEILNPKLIKNHKKMNQIDKDSNSKR